MFQKDNDTVTDNNRFIWFQKWIMERQVYRFLVRDSGMSESTLQRLFKRFMAQAPEVDIKTKHKTHLLTDGSYFPNGLCLILYYDHDIATLNCTDIQMKSALRKFKKTLKSPKT